MNILKGNLIIKPIDAIKNLFDELFTSQDEKNAAGIVIEKLKQHPFELQAEINKIEASSKVWFVAGWRPAVGWVCALAVFNEYLINPWLQWATGHPGPMMDTSELMTLLMAMLGLGYMRSNEKIKGVSK